MVVNDNDKHCLIKVVLVSIMEYWFDEPVSLSMSQIMVCGSGVYIHTYIYAHTYGLMDLLV